MVARFLQKRLQPTASACVCDTRIQAALWLVRSLAQNEPHNTHSACAHCLSFPYCLVGSLLLQCPRICSWRAAFAAPLLAWRLSRCAAVAAAACAAGAGAADEQHCWELPSVLTTCSEAAAVQQGLAYARCGLLRAGGFVCILDAVRDRECSWLYGDSMRGDAAAVAQAAAGVGGGCEARHMLPAGVVVDPRSSCCFCAVARTACRWLVPWGCV